MAEKQQKKTKAADFVPLDIATSKDDGKIVINGVDIDAFLAGKINVHDPGVLADKSKELGVWLAAMVELKNRGYDPEHVIKKFSKIPGFNERATRTSINYWWDRSDDLAKRLAMA